MLTIKKNNGQTNTNAKESIGFLAETPLKKIKKNKKIKIQTPFLSSVCNKLIHGMLSMRQVQSLCS
jgi:hypothetical protein